MHVLMTRVTKYILALMAMLVLGGLFVLVAWAAISLAQPPITHPGPESPGSPGEFPDCLACHQAGVAGAPRLVSDHVAHRNDDCLVCHEYLGHPDAATAHATLLVGKHVEAWCEDCHAGVQRPGYECASCHEPPGEPHFGTACEDCHTPAGFAGADRGEFEHVVALEGAHADLNCSDCHVGDEKLVFECAECHQPPSEPHFGADCGDCHTPAGFGEVDIGDFEHVVALEGAHANLNCSDCHVGDEKLVFECAECHEPPSEPHLGPDCEDCHTPAGFGEVDIGEFEHVVALEGAHADLNCSDCHVGDEKLVFECAECHQPPSEPHFGADCGDCHTPAGFGEVDIGDFEHVVALEGAHANLNCSDCHVGDEKLVFECAECHEPPSEPHLGPDCEDCHTPEGWPESAASVVTLAPEVPHELEGREDCLLCHDPEGQVMPAPSDHADYANEQCTICHQVVP